MLEAEIPFSITADKIIQKQHYILMFTNISTKQSYLQEATLWPNCSPNQHKQS